MLYVVIPQLPGVALLNPKAVLYKKLTVGWCSEINVLNPGCLA